MCKEISDLEQLKIREKLEYETKKELIKIGKRQIKQNEMLAEMRKQKKYLDIDPMTEFSDIEKLDFM